MARKRPTASRPRRRTGVRTPKKTLLVFCEGERTEPEYLTALRNEPAVRETAAVDIRLAPEFAGSVPDTLVRRATEALQKADEEDGEIDEVWCVFDVEWPRNHPRLKEAVRDATAAGVRLAISNPCFEIWLTLHFQDQSAWLTTAAAVKLRRTHDKSVDKGLDGKLYMPRRSEAAARAAALKKRHHGNESVFPHDNPSSSMNDLLESVGGLAP